MKTGHHYVCPFCNHPQTVTEDASREDYLVLGGASKHGDLELRAQAISCANKECREVKISAQLVTIKNPNSTPKTTTGTLKKWTLLPSSEAKPQPNYIPAPLIQDYEEACAIRDLSPKASATLARRCIQGMIRNFCEISKPTLMEEIKELRSRVESNKAPSGVHEDTLTAIDHVRTIGNIGAHMEKDINVIVDVDPNEAQTLIDLIELLFEEWYIARHTRTQKLASLMKVADDKKAARTG